MRRGIAKLIEHESDPEVCGEAENEDEAMQKLVDLEPHIVLVDISLKDSNGLNLIKNINSLYDGLRTLVLSIYNENTYAEKALLAGVKGFVCKEDLGKLLQHFISSSPGFR